ncbi:MAG: low affinity iron permease family protein [Burkholderiales bacterium]|nr:low affinity iron permease family protein [Burkholderiales bacterium]
MTGRDSAAVLAPTCIRKGRITTQSLNESFRRGAAAVAAGLGSPWSFASAVALVLLWAAVGPVVGYSANWQLVINTGTTIATFLMLFVLQNSQNRDTKAVNVKLDELLRALKGARTALAAAGDMSDEALEQLEQGFRALADTPQAESKVVSDNVTSESAPIVPGISKEAAI